MSAWKLVEAVEEVRQADTNSNGFSDKRGGRGGRGGRGMTGGRRSTFGARNGTSRGGGYHDRGNRTDEVYEIDPQMKEYYAHMAVQQIELIYGTDYLCVDTYFRSYMDEEGFVPMALLTSYPNIACYGTPISELVSKLSQKEDSILEVDVTNETVRLKEGWEKWLMPNASGSRGVPKYVKQLEGSSDGRNGTYFNREWSDSDVGTGEVEGTEKDASSSTPDENQRSESNRITSDTGSLSASAAEFKPKVTVAATPVGNGKVSYAAAAAKISNSA